MSASQTYGKILVQWVTHVKNKTKQKNSVDATCETIFPIALMLKKKKITF